MVEIRIDNTGDGTWWIYANNKIWKEYVCEDFDEMVVLMGNRDYGGCTEASWYQRAKDILNDISDYDEYPSDVSDEVSAKLKELYDSCSYIEEIIFDVIKLLYPEETFKTGIIRGYTQSEWQEYIVKDDVNTEQLEAMYFGKIADISVETDIEDGFSDVITHDELWEAERGDIKEFMRKRYDFAEDEEIHIYRADGMKQVVDWKQVC